MQFDRIVISLFFVLYVVNLALFDSVVHAA